MMAGLPADFPDYIPTASRPPIPPETRANVLARADGHCEVCGRRAPLDLHHLHYRTIGREEAGDLQARCRECHRAAHVGLAGEWWNDPEEKEAYYETFYREAALG